MHRLMTSCLLWPLLAAGPAFAQEAELARLAWLGGTLDPVANDAGAPRISTPASRVALLVIPTDEELMIARHTLVGARHDLHPLHPKPRALQRDGAMIELFPFVFTDRSRRTQIRSGRFQIFFDLLQKLIFPG